MSRRAGLWMAVIGIFFMLAAGCRSTTDIPKEAGNIRVEMVNRSDRPEALEVTIKLKNGSGHTIKQNDAFMSFQHQNANRGEDKPFQDRRGGKSARY